MKGQDIPTEVVCASLPAGSSVQAEGTVAPRAPGGRLPPPCGFAGGLSPPHGLTGGGRGAAMLGGTIRSLRWGGLALKPPVG